MSKTTDLLKVTTQDLHRFWFLLHSQEQWYAVMAECRQWFGTNWKSQPRVRRKLPTPSGHNVPALAVWFDVPDIKFATWIAVKHSIQVSTLAPVNNMLCS